jgi:hypothetical protein
MTKSKTDKKKKPPQLVDFFIETTYTSNTASGIAELHKTTKFKCVNCKTRDVESKMVIRDRVVPTFALHRKKYCVSCWLKLVI